MTATTRSRLAPDERRSQLLDLGVRLLASRSLDELSIDLLAEEAGISRGLLYHYFGNKHAFHEAVVRRAADDLIAQTAPPVDGDPLERPAERVADDVRSGYVSAENAACDYGVALDERQQPVELPVRRRNTTKSRGSL